MGNGLTKEAAEQMGLWEGCPVGCSLIDAHAGGIGKSTLSFLIEIIIIILKKLLGFLCPSNDEGTAGNPKEKMTDC